MNSITFHSLAAMADFIQSNERQSNCDTQSASTYSCDVQESHALEIARSGGRYDTDVEKLKTAMAGMPKYQRIETTAPAVQSNVVGFAPVVPNAMMGLPDSMLCMEPEPAAPPVIKIGVHVGRASCVEESTVYLRAAALLAALDVLHAQGHRTELWACWRNTNMGIDCHYDVLVKPESSNWDWQIASFVFANPAMQRRLFWNVAERHTRDSAELTDTGNYGHESSTANDGFDVYFGRLNDDLRNMTEAQAKVSAALAASGLVVEFSNAA